VEILQPANNGNMLNMSNKLQYSVHNFLVKRRKISSCVGIFTRNNDVYILTFSPSVLFLFFSLTFLDRVVVKKAEGGYVQLDPTFQLLVFLIRKFNLIPK
jgi:hypothetical protein